MIYRVTFLKCCVLLILLALPVQPLRSETPDVVLHPTKQNIFSFAPVSAKFVEIRLVSDDYGDVALDEVEAFSPGAEENIALSSAGTVASASSCIPNFPTHKVEHLNDGLFGNERSWISLEKNAWVRLAFPREVVIDRVSISRDRKERVFMDRLPKSLEIFVSGDGKNWTSVRKIERFASWLERNNNDRPINTPESVRYAIEDMIRTFGDQYPDGQKTLQELIQFENRFQQIDQKSPEFQKLTDDFSIFQRRVLLANPLLDFDQILVVRGNRMAAPNNNFVTTDWVPKEGFDNELAIVSQLRDEPVLTTIYRTPNGRPIAEPELHWDGEKVMFSSISEENKRWGIFEVRTDGSELKTLTPVDQPDVDFYDSCYVPDGTIITASNANMQSLPCMGGAATMVNLFKVDPETKKVRQITFEQDSDWHPTMMRDGRVMYMRWEYTDMMHYFSRILFHMNPDGTNQRELYGSGSLFPTTLKHAREIPDSSEIVVILSGHHGRGDTGRMAIIDPNVARKYPFVYKPTSKEWGIEGDQLDVHPEILPAEQTGFIQEFPGFGRDVVGNVLDNQADGLKYNFVFPYPLSKNYFLVTCQIAGDPNSYGLYLADRFDNLTLIKQIPNQGLFNPIPLIAQTPPMFRPDRTDPSSDTATVFITDVYDGVGMKGVPKGVVKKLRIFTYHYAYNERGGHDALGVHSGWDIKHLLGEVPVEDDGSVMFEMPANTPVSLQPLDEQGRAVQLMRSWMVGMPGEMVSCNGCHESQLEVTPARQSIASRKKTSAIEPFYGPARTITFETEVYHPVVKKYCMECHDGKESDRPSFADANLAYQNIHPFVRCPGPETDMEVFQPMEYHASTSLLCKMLEKNHHNVVLSAEAKERLYCWIDLNSQKVGKWNHPELSQRRMEIEALYSSVVHDYENDFDSLLSKVRSTPIEPVPMQSVVHTPADDPEVAKRIALLSQKKIWPFDSLTAKAMPESANVNGETTKVVEVAPGLKMTFVRIPAGTFVLGNKEGAPDEIGRSIVQIEQPFWMSTTEVTNAQYAAFDSQHDSRYHEEHGKDHIVPGYIANHPDQPVSRISWDEANRYAKWFSERFQVVADLPTESQWEWAARAGSDSQFYYGTLDTDFSRYANLAGGERRCLYTSWINGSTLHRRNPYPENSVFPLRDDRFSDKWFTVDYVAQYEPNAWGLYDMIGNNAEWTKSNYRPYPYRDDDGRNNAQLRERKTVRGGSWYDRPKNTGSATRNAYEPWQKVFDVGFRLILR